MEIRLKGGLREARVWEKEKDSQSCRSISDHFAFDRLGNGPVSQCVEAETQEAVGNDVSSGTTVYK